MDVGQAAGCNRNKWPLAVTVTNGVGSINLAVWNFASDGCGDKFQPIR